MPSIDIEFAGAEVQLSGTFTWPIGVGGCPVVVLVGGSGPSDRHNDGLFDLLAGQLVGDGIAVLRYDKRGAGNSTGWWPAATVDDLAADAVAAVTLLRSSPPAAVGRVGVLGHSEGGWVALRAALGGLDPDFLILNSCPAVSFLESEVYALTRAGVEQELARMLMESLVASVRSGNGPDDGRRILASLEDEPWYSAVAGFEIDESTWTQLGAWCDYDPTSDLERLQAPTLIVLGGNDVLVPVHDSVARYHATAARNGRSQHVRVFADGDHRLQTSAGFAPTYIATISRWCRGEPLPA